MNREQMLKDLMEQIKELSRDEKLMLLDFIEGLRKEYNLPEPQEETEGAEK